MSVQELAARLCLMLILTLHGCGDGDGDERPRYPAEAEVYATVLTDSAVGVPGTIALDPQLISSSGTYAPSGRLAEATIAELRRRGLVAEVCGEKRREHGFIECTTRRARAAVQLSRVLPGRGDTVLVRIGRNTVQPRGDTAFHSRGFASRDVCLLVPHDTGWRVVRCELEMIT
ncbi:MAG TPA: hypothetical protein VLK84_06805 [Longimicrobium sp.]|nr:hypothetical protein [Longimicrobium sp.]